MTEHRLLDSLPAARFWIEAGIQRGQAGKLVRAGFPSLESLAEATRDELLAVPGIGRVTVEACERLLGRRLPSVIGDWRDQGFSAPAAAALAEAGIDSMEALARLTDEEIGAFGLRSPDHQLFETLLGRHPLAAPLSGRQAEVERALRAVHQQVLQQLAILFPRAAEAPVMDPAQLALWEAGRVIESVLGGAPKGLDLTVEDPETIAILHSEVVRRYFSLRVLAAPGAVRVPAHTPEECRLRVIFEHGRYAATWLRLDVDESQPEVRRRALILFETGRQGELVETEV